MTKVGLLIDEARVAELRRDADRLKNILSNFPDEWEVSLLLKEYPAEKAAELLRLYGFYLTFYGRAKNLKDYSARAKDALTDAHKLFTEQRNAAKAAESNVLLAFCYWNAGEVENCEAFLGLSEMDFHEPVSHPVVLQIKINQLMLLCWMERF